MNGLTFQYDAVPGAASPIDVQAAAFPNDDWFFDAVGRGGRSDAGVTVSPMSALGHGPVWQAVNILAGDVGQLPFRKMRRRRRNNSSGAAQWETEKDDMHWCDFLLRDSPNEWQTPGLWKETMMAWALLWGNAICVIDRPRSDMARLVPLPPWSTDRRQEGLGEWTITTRLEHTGAELEFDYRDCFHLRGLATDGFWGLSVVSIAKNVIGHGMALQKHGDAVFKNAARPSGYLRKPEGALSPEARANLRKEWDAIHAGSHNAGRIAVLWEGMEFHPMSMSNEDAQWLEGRKLDREFIASLFNLPAFKLNALENSAVRANLEEQNRDYFNTSLARWTNKFAEEAQRKLLTEKERRSNRHFFKWFPEAFLRGDTRTRFESYGLAITHQWMSPNEVRQLEDMNPYEGGDDYANPAINVAKADAPAESTETNDDQAEAASALVRDRVTHMLQAEANRIKAASKKVRDFVGWLDRYYESLEDVAAEFLQAACALAAMCGHTDNWRTAIRDHAARSRLEWLALLDMVTHDELPEAVAKAADALPAKADDLTRRILGHG